MSETLLKIGLKELGTVRLKNNSHVLEMKTEDLAAYVTDEENNARMRPDDAAHLRNLSKAFEHLRTPPGMGNKPEVEFVLPAG